MSTTKDLNEDFCYKKINYDPTYLELYSVSLTSIMTSNANLQPHESIFKASIQPKFNTFMSISYNTNFLELPSLSSNVNLQPLESTSRAHLKPKMSIFKGLNEGILEPFNLSSNSGMTSYLLRVLPKILYTKKWRLPEFYMKLFANIKCNNDPILLPNFLIPLFEQLLDMISFCGYHLLS